MTHEVLGYDCAPLPSAFALSDSCCSRAACVHVIYRSGCGGRLDRNMWEMFSLDTFKVQRTPFTSMSVYPTWPSLALNMKTGLIHVIIYLFINFLLYYVLFIYSQSLQL